jgi:hypothetical protein
LSAGSWMASSSPLPPNEEVLPILDSHSDRPPMMPVIWSGELYGNSVVKTI